MNYKTPKTVPAKPTIAETPGLIVPKVIAPDTGIHIIRKLTGDVYKIWFHNDGKKRYLTLPTGITLEGARTRRNKLYANLRKKYGAIQRTPKTSNTLRKSYTTKLGPTTYIYPVPERVVPAHFAIRIRGAKIATADTREQAVAKRDKWLAENPGTVRVK